jgi:plasmid stabilization system protein ParE
LEAKKDVTCIFFLAQQVAQFDAAKRRKLAQALETAIDMSRSQTPEEVRQQHLDSMGEDLGALYHALWNELVWLYAKWGEYVEMFGTKPSRVELVNQAAGHFFRVIQDSLWEDTLLHIARLSDPPKSKGKDNLTIRRLPQLIHEPDVKKNVSELIEIAVRKADFCRDWRNRHIAHKDMGLALKSGAEPLKPASRAKVKEALGAIAEVLNAVSGHYMKSTTAFEGVGNWNGAVSLLYVIDDGLRAARERQERLRAGEYLVDDYRARDL